MSFPIFDCPDPSKFDAIVSANQKSPETLKKLAAVVGDALPKFLIDYLQSS